MSFTRQDKDLYSTLCKATRDEKLLLSKIIAEKYSSDIDGDCTAAYKIARELQLMGGHSAANKWRGHGVCYKELATDAAEKVGADVNESDDIATIERRLLETLIDKAMKKMSKEEKEAFYKEVEEKGGSKAYNWKDAVKQGAMITPALYMILAEVAMPYILRTLGMQAALAFVGGRAVGAAVPVIGWGLALGSVMHSAAGTAFKVTIPCTAYVGAIRARIKAEEAAEELSL